MSQNAKKNVCTAALGFVLAGLIFSLSTPVLVSKDTSSGGGGSIVTRDEIAECKKKVREAYNACMRSAREHRRRCLDRPGTTHAECQDLFSSLVCRLPMGERPGSGGL